MSRRNFFVALFLLLILTGISFGGNLISKSFYSKTLGEDINYNVYLPDDYDKENIYYPVVYLLHGRGGSKSDWLSALNIIDKAVGNGDCPSIIAVLPDAPYYSGGSYYVDSEYGEKSYKVETAFNKDLIEEINNNYRCIDDRTGRIVCGFSMGGYGALRYALEYPQIYSGAIVLSPAVYNPLPPEDSSAREFGGFGRDSEPFVEEIYLEKSYVNSQKHYESFGLRSKIFIMVGDDEWQCGDYVHDLDYEAHTLYKYLQKFSGLDSQLRITDGGHGWEVWNPGFENGLSFMNDILSQPIDTKNVKKEDKNYSVVNSEVFGNTGEDTAGGMAVDSEGITYLAANMEGGYDSFTSLGSKDVYVIKTDVENNVEWVKQLGTESTDKAYAMCVGNDGNVYLAGYTKGNIDGKHPENSKDDVFLAAFDKEGNTIWIRQFGDSANADRGYAINSYKNRIYVSGYTKGEIADKNKGDKDIFLAVFSTDGDMLWNKQFGTPGEEKCQGIAVDEDENVYLAGLTSGEFEKGNGDYDIFVASYDSEGEMRFIRQYGTDAKDEAYDILYSDGMLKLTGLTAGDFASVNKGDKDVFLLHLDRTGKILGKKQFGTDLNDKGVKLYSDGKYDYLACISDGNFDTNEGKFDSVIIKTDCGEFTEFYQIGTFENDGADDWAEGNLYIAGKNGTVLLAGITYGHFGGVINLGSSDVFCVEMKLSE